MPDCLDWRPSENGANDSSWPPADTDCSVEGMDKCSTLSPVASNLLGLESVCWHDIHTQGIIRIIGYTKVAKQASFLLSADFIAITIV